MGILELLGLRRPAPAASASAPAAPRIRRGPDGFVIPNDGKLARAHHLVEDFLVEVCAATAGNARSTAAGRRIRDSAPELQVEIVLAAMERSVWQASPERKAKYRTHVFPFGAGDDEIVGLLQLPLPFTPGQLERLIQQFFQAELPSSTLETLIAHAARLMVDAPMREALRPALESVRPGLVAKYPWKADPRHQGGMRELFAQIYFILHGDEGPYLDPEPWVERLAADIEGMDADARPRWWALVRHLLEATSAKPTARWLKEARRLADEVGRDELIRRARAWMALAPGGLPEPMPLPNADLLRGLVWYMADLGGDDEARAIGDLGLALAKKIPNVGVRSLKALNACVTALGGMPGSAPVAQLSRLRARVKHAQAQGVIETTLRAAAEQRGVGPDELEEMVVPTFGMDEPGVLREEFGEWTAEVRVTGTASVETSWVRPDGKRQKSAPAELKEAWKEELAALKKTAGEMAKMLPVQRDRIEALPMAERVIPYGAWRERYVDHPLLAELTRRLIWRFETGDEVRAGIWHDGALVDAGSASVEGLGEETRVSLWHPIHATVDEVRGWRAWLDAHGVTQPFKQAHREIYLLTDAERTTGTYSNRFAGHILRQHQLAALGRERGWQYRLQGHFDNSNAPTLQLPRYGMFAEFFVDVAGDRHDVSQHFISLHVSTDQVRFRTPGEGRWQSDAVELEDIPPLVFSEVMRDVDLFVGVTSVGTDPQWGNRDHDAPYGGYWQSFAFGELSPTAVTRAEVLQRLLPRLKIRDVCTLDGRFLVVRGSLRTYKIHLGSGNILMEPNDQYLCIVPEPGARVRQNLVLPFEGDSTLSLILSKAFLLADDAKITDPVITAQLSGEIRPR
jgi:hypothetical protein